VFAGLFVALWELRHSDVRTSESSVVNPRIAAAFEAFGHARRPTLQNRTAGHPSAWDDPGGEGRERA
jgi:hypothetical protein